MPAEPALPQTKPQTPALARTRGFSRASIRRRLWLDRWMSWFVTGGGLIIIFVILAILFIIGWVAYPLFQSPGVAPMQGISFAEAHPNGVPFTRIFSAGADEYRDKAYLATDTGLHFYSLATGKPLALPQPEILSSGKILAAGPPSNNRLAMILEDNRVAVVKIAFDVTFQDGARQVEPSLEAFALPGFPELGKPITHMASAFTSKGIVIAATDVAGQLALIQVEERKNLAGAISRQETRRIFALPPGSATTALLLHDGGETLFTGAGNGQILGLNMRQAWSEKDVEFEFLGAMNKSGVTMLGLLFGGQTLIAGDASGQVISFLLFKNDSTLTLKKLRVFAPHDKPVTLFHASRRDKGFITADAGGTTRYHYGTSGATQYEAPPGSGGKPAAALLAPKADGLILVDAASGVRHYAVNNPHPDVNFNTLFRKIIYEGFSKPEFVWQSTGGADDFESKYSLAPLIYGTLKGTFYAIVFAMPLALLAAFYTSQFMHNGYRKIVKPAIEIMAALPSVVLGFFAALWLAPNVEKHLPGIILTPFIIFALVTLYLLGKESYPALFKTGKKPGAETVVLAVLVLLGGWAGAALGGPVEALLLGSDYRAWLGTAAGLDYDQRNSLVVGLAMGFAVIPIIFTIAEDSLSGVPAHLKAASLALGATPWQTAVNVILPTASPGIFSAVMVGFGRAVGETMIVLMATGNTPIMKWNPFDGFRALSANIAVELPEAPEGGSLYRILFLAALLLFIMTFLVNTLAEWIRLRLRRKYRVL